MLREICTRRSPTPTPSSIVDFLHLDSLVSQALVFSRRGGYLCTAVGHAVATMPPSQDFSWAYLYRGIDIVHWKRRSNDAVREDG